MKKFLILFAFVFMSIDCFAATPRPSGRAPGSNTAAPAANNANTAVRAARGAPVVRGGNVAAPVQNVSVSRSATTPKVSSARSATTPTTGKVTARAAKQNAIVGGTKVAAAGQNTVVDDACRAKFDGCMDSFCMLDNANGGRCLCSDRSKELNAVLLEIEKLDNQSYKMATAGVEKIEMGEDGDAVLASADAATKAVLGEDNTKTKRRALDLTAWNKSTDFDSDDEFDLFGASSDENSVEGKEGDALYNASYKLCQAQMPECVSSMNMLTALYKQRVRSDCVAYENSLKKQRDASAQKLAAAETALREAALEQYRSANKYDLGQCTIEFKQCMKTTAGCGDDFSGCATVAATAEAQTKSKSTKKVSKQYAIKGPSVTISIAAATYDTLDAKKPLCMNVTKNCVNVRDQVWDAFLREVAPELKSAELIAESNLRDSCIENISSCFQKACKDNLDPNDPDGSYDICLSRPQALESFCKVQIQPCQAAYPSIMEDSILPRLASIRTDACTKEFKECLTSEDRCGEDYSQCIGLDTATIVDMCPAEKLTACYYEYNNNTESVTEALDRVATGIFNNIDDKMVKACNKAADDSMIKVCGSTDNCDNLMVDTLLGTRSMKYQVCAYDKIINGQEQWNGPCYSSWSAIPIEELKKYNNSATAAADGTNRNYDLSLAEKNTGKIYWDSINLNYDDNITDVAEIFPSANQYLDAVKENNGNAMINDDEVKEAYNLEIAALINATTGVIKAIEADKKVQDCMGGRTFQGMRGADGNSTTLGSGTARFPYLTTQMRRLIATSVIKFASSNYAKKTDEETSRLRKEHLAAIKSVNNSVDADSAEKICKDIENEDYPGHTPPKKRKAGDNEDKNWNFVYKVSASFNRATGDCTVIRTTQNCKKVKKNYCKEWEDPKEEASVINLLK